MLLFFFLFFCVLSKEKIKSPKISYIFEKTFFLLFAVIGAMKMEKGFKKKNQIEILRILSLM